MTARRVVSMVFRSRIGNIASQARYESSDGGSKPQAVDFVQQLFLDKIREYAKKKKDSGGQMFEPIEELEKERADLHGVLLKTFYKAEEPPSDPTAFPDLEFKDAPLDSIDLGLEELKRKKK